MRNRNLGALFVCSIVASVFAVGFISPALARMERCFSGNSRAIIPPVLLQSNP